jgi:hypothetical protein
MFHFFRKKVVFELKKRSISACGAETKEKTEGKPRPLLRGTKATEKRNLVGFSPSFS